MPAGAATQATQRSATAGTHVIDKNRPSADMPARIMFDIGSDRLDEASQAKLNEILATMTAYPDWDFAVEGHTDAYGAPEYNRSLSERRAQAVKSYLEAAGIASERISVAAFGASRPVAPNNAQGRALNRRVEIRRQ